MRLPLTRLLVCLCLSASADPTPPAPASPTAEVETVVFIRHGEKPAADLGQLNCQGLNRALALPNVLIPRYGKPNFIFAPNPTKKVGLGGAQFSYIRPLMTIEPTAIRLGLPVNTTYAFDDLDGIARELTGPSYEHSLIFVAWEHKALNQLVKNLIKSLGGDPGAVPAKWESPDFDSIYILKIGTESGHRTVSFAHEQEGLNGESPDCPEAKPE